MQKMHQEDSGQQLGAKQMMRTANTVLCRRDFFPLSITKGLPQHTSEEEDLERSHKNRKERGSTV